MLSCCLNALTRWNETKIGKVSKVRSTGYRTRNHSPETIDFSPNELISATLSVSVFSVAATAPIAQSVEVEGAAKLSTVEETYVVDDNSST